MSFDAWSCKNLGDAMLAAEALQSIEHLFESLYGQDPDHQGTAVFIRHESEGRLHCEVKVYFPPQAAQVAVAVGAAPCPKPLAADLSLLVGSIDAWQRYFPRQPF